MNVLAILRDAWFFYSRHFLTIVRLCLPLILLESLTRLGIDHWLGDNAPPALDLLVGLIFYPLYVGALILFLDARSRGHDPALGAVYARALPLWPALAVLSGLGTLLILLGASLFVLPGIWVMVKIAFAEYLLVLRGLTPLAALKQSFQLTRGHFLLNPRVRSPGAANIPSSGSSAPSTAARPPSATAPTWASSPPVRLPWMPSTEPPSPPARSMKAPPDHGRSMASPITVASSVIWTVTRSRRPTGTPR